ncbi:hypothetical protein DRJ17_03605 [Candidatus Woesearchaeota archaeon]|nr:MAG: hypothetical protein DRJ17_03605 [Candidatus Woesearchaeota archaeon]
MLRIFKKRETWERIDRYIKNAFERVKSDIHHIYSWINYLKHKDELNDHEHSQFNRELGEQKMMIQYVLSRIEQLESASIPRQRTSQGQIKDTSRTFRGQIGDIKGHVKDTHLVAKKSDLTGAQMELLQLFYHSDRPLSYDEISKRLQKKPKSIRNLIYEIRDKGIEIKDKPIGIREKGFYIDRDLKIELSGR